MTISPLIFCSIVMLLCAAIFVASHISKKTAILSAMVFSLLSAISLAAHLWIEAIA